VRIDSNIPSGLPNVAFKIPDDKIVIIVLNDSGSEKQFNIKTGTDSITTSLSGGSVGTYIW
jgi:glucosylceramidase